MYQTETDSHIFSKKAYGYQSGEENGEEKGDEGRGTGEGEGHELGGGG